MSNIIAERPIRFLPPLAEDDQPRADSREQYCYNSAMTDATPFASNVFHAVGKRSAEMVAQIRHKTAIVLQVIEEPPWAATAKRRLTQTTKSKESLRFIHWPSIGQIERLICNSRKSFCVHFHRLAHCCGRSVIRPFSVRAALRRIARFCRQKFLDRRSDREKFRILACALHGNFTDQVPSRTRYASNLGWFSVKEIELWQLDMH
jgi:hypothetical protein